MKATENKYIGFKAILHLGLFFATAVTFLNSAVAQDYIIDRAPANYAHNDDLVIVPDRVEHWSENVMVDDDAGVLGSIRAQISNWNQREQYVQEWDLDSTGLYPLATQEEKKSYFMRNILRYMDKRLAGEVKSAEQGSAMRSVGQVHRAMRPNSEVGISENVRLKFKARALQGKAFMIVENPWVDAQSTVSVDGRIDLRVAKQFKDLGVKSEVRYRLQDDVWVAQVDKSLTEEISARVSNEQNMKSKAFGNESNRTVQLMYNRPF